MSGSEAIVFKNCSRSIAVLILNTITIDWLYKVGAYAKAFRSHRLRTYQSYFFFVRFCRMRLSDCGLMPKYDATKY